MFVTCITPLASGQVLISLLLGDKLNTGKIEFGLEGGFNWSNFHNDDVGDRVSVETQTDQAGQAGKRGDVGDIVHL